MIKSPVGILFAAAGLILAVSPEARKTARKLTVKGVEVLLDFNDHLKTRANSAAPMEYINNRNHQSNSANMGILETEQPHIHQ